MILQVDALGGRRNLITVDGATQLGGDEYDVETGGALEIAPLAW